MSVILTSVIELGNEVPSEASEIHPFPLFFSQQEFVVMLHCKDARCDCTVCVMS